MKATWVAMVQIHDQVQRKLQNTSFPHEGVVVVEERISP